MAGRRCARAYGRFTTADPSINATQVNGNAPFTPTVSLVPTELPAIRAGERPQPVSHRRG